MNQQLKLVIWFVELSRIIQRFILLKKMSELKNLFFFLDVTRQFQLQTLRFSSSSGRTMLIRR